MSENAPTPNTSNAQQAPSLTPPGGTSSSATGSTEAANAASQARDDQGRFAPQAWRAGDTAPEWARGKSAEEVLGIAQNLVETFERYGTASAPSAQQQSYQQQPTSNNVPPVSIADDDYITGAQMRSLLADVAAKQVTPQIQGSVDMAATANLGIVRREHADMFKRYGNEITQKLATVPRHMWTLDNVETVVKLVKADHLDELLREGAAELAANMEPTIRSTGGGSAPVPQNKDVSLESDKIPAEWKKRALASGITERTVQEFCFANDMTPEQFYKQFEHLDKYEGKRNPIVSEFGRREAANA